MIKKLLLFSIALFLVTTSFSQIEIVKNGKATGRILVDQSSKSDNQAATLLNDFVKKISGTTLPIVANSTKHHKGDIIIKSFGSEERQIISSKIEEDRSPAVKYVNYEIPAKEKISTRYIKVHVENVGIGPSWHYGVRYPVWLFMDEIWVY